MHQRGQRSGVDVGSGRECVAATVFSLFPSSVTLCLCDPLLTYIRWIGSETIVTAE